MDKDPKVLVIGGDSRLARVFKRMYGRDVVALTKNECNLLAPQSIERAFKSHLCPYILNCAAITDIEQCESKPKECFNINIIGPSLLNGFCKKYNRKLIHISSNYAHNPTNTYGLSKYVSEKILDANALIICTSFYDSETYAMRQLLQKRSVIAYDNLEFNPISIYKLVKEIFTNRERVGHFAVFTNKPLTMYDFALKISEVFSVDRNLVRKSKYIYTPAKATRPYYSYVKPDITVDIEDDLKNFKNTLLNKQYKIS